MFRFGALISGGLLLAACNVASFSYPAERFRTIDSASFSELMTTSLDQRGDKTVFGPKIAYSMGSYGGLAVVHKANGDTVYKFYSRLEYMDEFARSYDTVTDVSGSKLPSTTTGGREGNGGYRVEFVNVDLTLEKLEEAKFDGLFLTIAAKEHERKMARLNRGRPMGIGEALRLAREASGQSNPEIKDNDNFDLSVPANYIRTFLREVNKQ